MFLGLGSFLIRLLNICHNKGALQCHETVICNKTMEYKEKIVLIKSLSQTPISDDEALLAYEKLVRFFVTLYKVKKGLENG